VCTRTQNNQALPCPQGTYKVGTDKAPACLPCPSGLTTPTNSAASPASCSLAAPGYRPTSVNGTTFTVEACPAGSYGLDGLQCLSCANNLTTQSEATATPAACLAPPGHGYYSDGVGDSSPITTANLAGSKVVKCPQGSFKVGQAGARQAARLTANAQQQTTKQTGHSLARCPPLAAPPPGWMEPRALHLVWQGRADRHQRL
jgi:hypothetical protein